jgi:hypothetical protein
MRKPIWHVAGKTIRDAEVWDSQETGLLVLSLKFTDGTAWDLAVRPNLKVDGVFRKNDKDSGHVLVIL